MSADLIRSIEIEVSDYCNLKCPLCSRSSVLDISSINKNHLDLSIIKELKDSLNDRVEFILSGVFGDPMMHPQIDKLCTILVDRHQAPVTLTTNGSLREEKLYQRLGQVSASSQNLFLEFSIDGLKGTSEQYRIGSQFDKVIRNAESFISSGGLATLKMIVFRHNESQVNDLKAMAKDMGFEKFKLVYSSRFTKEMDVESSTIKPSAKIQDGSFSLKGDELNFESEISCRFQQNGALYISAEGLIYPCCYLGADAGVSPYWKEMLEEMGWNQEKPFNSIAFHSLDEILDHPFFQSYVSRGWSEVLRTSKTCYTHCSRERLLEKRQLSENHGLKVDVQ